jgi:hypothetical protein
MGSILTLVSQDMTVFKMLPEWYFGRVGRVGKIGRVERYDRKGVDQVDKIGRGERRRLSSKKLIGMFCSILVWMNSDNEEGSKIECGPDGPCGKFHVSAMLYGTNDKGPRGYNRWKLIFNYGYNRWKVID